jgi:hypothetical protein
MQQIYAYWQMVPAGVRAGLGLLVMGVVAAGLAFGWRFPADWADAKEQLAAFWLIVVPIAYGIFQKSIWPPLFEWVLSLMGLAQTMDGTELVAEWHK